MNKINKYFVRNIEAGDLLENFLISAVASILVIRFYLAATGYPQIGNDVLHISHMLWGGLLMMISIFCLLMFLNRSTKSIAAIIGGIGFGTFIDELGKFITQDNNYFFLPTIALIYVIFVVIYLLYKLVDSQYKMSKKEYAVNALDMMREAVISDFDIDEKRMAKQFLKNSDSKDPVVVALKEAISKTKTIHPEEQGFFSQLYDLFKASYLKLIKNSAFAIGALGLFILITLLSIAIYTVGLISHNTFEQWGLFLSSILSGIFVFIGIYYYGNNLRMKSYNMFKNATLVSIFLTQFFLLYKEQLSAITRLGIAIVVWNVLQNLIREKSLTKQKKKTDG